MPFHHVAKDFQAEIKVYGCYHLLLFFNYVIMSISGEHREFCQAREEPTLHTQVAW
jgi:hypothetical protein